MDEGYWKKLKVRYTKFKNFKLLARHCKMGNNSYGKWGF